MADANEGAGRISEAAGEPDGWSFKLWNAGSKPTHLLHVFAAPDGNGYVYRVDKVLNTPVLPHLSKPVSGGDV